MDTLRRAASVTPSLGSFKHPAVAIFQQSQMRPLKGALSVANGFCEQVDTAPSLPYEFQEWDEAARKISELGAKIVDYVECMPILKFEPLKLSFSQIKRSRMILAMLFQAYLRWSGGKLPVPQAILEPLEKVSSLVGLPPVGCFEDLLSLTNRDGEMFFPLLPSDSDQQSLEAEKQFYKTLKLLSEAAASLLHIILNVIYYMDKGEVDKLSEHLVLIADLTFKLDNIFSRQINPHVIAPIIWQRDLVFFTVGENGKPGPNGFQYVPILALDIVLGRFDYSSELGQISKKIMNYIPENHRKFIECLTKGPSLRSFVEKTNYPKLTQMYNAAVASYSGGILRRHCQTAVTFLRIGMQELEPRYTTGGAPIDFSKTEPPWEQVDRMLQESLSERLVLMLPENNVEPATERLLTPRKLQEGNVWLILGVISVFIVLISRIVR